MRLCSLIVTLVLIGSPAAGTIAAQQTPPQDGQPKKETPAAPIVGELIAVDADAKTLAVKTATGEEVKFSYTDQTEVVGAEKGALGLAPGPKTEVAVHYDLHGTARVATRIEVRQKQ